MLAAMVAGRERFAKHACNFVLLRVMRVVDNPIYA